MPLVGILMEEEQQIIPCVETKVFAWVPQPKDTGISLQGWQSEHHSFIVWLFPFAYVVMK